MTSATSPAALFKSHLTKAKLRQTFDEFIKDGAAVGCDGISVTAFEKRMDQEIDIIHRKVNAGTYEFSAYREKLISKGAQKSPRQLSIPTVRDKLTLKFLSELLADIYPSHVSRVPHLTIKSVHEVSSSRPATDSYLRLDIQTYFPSIDHKILMRILRRRIRKRQVLHLIENAICTPTGCKKSAETLNNKGVPQGLSISNLLSSLYLSDIDDHLTNIAEIDNFRFVDDILIVGTHDKIQEISRTLPKLLKSKRKLKCHEVGEGSKSVIIPLAEGIEYLGYRFCLDDIEVRESSFKKMFANIMKLITSMKYASNIRPLIWKMNLRISGCQFQDRRIGWLFFFAQSKNTQQLKQLDASQASKILSHEDRAHLKRFVKAYHEIRYNADKTGYFPNFDKFKAEQKKEQISFLMPYYDCTKLDALPEEQLDQLFKKCIRREISDLEKDMMEVFSSRFRL